MTLNFVTEFMRQVIEAGIPFGTNHMYILLLQLRPEEIQTTLISFIKVLLESLSMTKVDFEDFIDGIRVGTMKSAYESIIDKLYVEQWTSKMQMSKVLLP